MYINVLKSIKQKKKKIINKGDTVQLFVLYFLFKYITDMLTSNLEINTFQCVRRLDFKQK